MKKVEAIIKAQALGAAARALRGAGLDDVTIAEVRGRGRRRGWQEIYRGAVYEVDTIGKLRLELLVPDERVDEVVSLLCRVARTRGLGNGKVLVTAVHRAPPGRA